MYVAATESIFKFSLADQLTSKYIPPKKDPDIGIFKQQ
jgi:hypothetical protein